MDSCSSVISVDSVNEALTKFEENINRVRGEVDGLQPTHTDGDDASRPKKWTRKPDEVKPACKEACDIMISQARHRFSSVGQLIPLQLVDPRLFDDYSTAFPTKN